MKAAIRRRANTKLVQRKEEVLALISHALDTPLATPAAAAALARTLEGSADELGLQLCGAEGWAQRLEIGKKGAAGEWHFSEAERARAAEAQLRLLAARSVRTWTEQLRAQADAATRAADDASAARGASARRGRGAGGGAARSRGQQVEHCRDVVHGALRTWRAIFDDPSFRGAARDMAARAVPHALPAEAERLVRALGALGHTLAALARDELVRAARVTARARGVPRARRLRRRPPLAPSPRRRRA